MRGSLLSILARRRQTDRRLSFGVYVVIVVAMVALMSIASVLMVTNLILLGTLPWQGSYGLMPWLSFHVIGWVVVLFLISIALSVITWWYSWQLYKRRNLHIERSKELRRSVAGWLREQHGATFSEVSMPSYESAEREQYRSTGFFVAWVILAYVFGLVGFILMLVAWYWLSRDYVVHEWVERQFFSRVAEILKGKEISFDAAVIQPLPSRNMVLYIVLTCIPGVNVVWSIWWTYTLFRDPNVHFDTHEYWERQLESIIRGELPRTRGSEGSIAILKERYAKGELSKEEFDRMRQDLRDQ